MRKTLLLLCILSITIQVQAQNPAMLLKAPKKWVVGGYNDLDGKSHMGLISWMAPNKSFLSDTGDRIFFKPSRDEAQVALKSSQIQSFVMDTVAYVVSHNPAVKKTPFLQIVMKKNGDFLYRAVVSRTIGGFSGGIGLASTFEWGDYYFGTNPEAITKLNKKNFDPVMSNLMSDKPWAVRKIKDGTFDGSNIEKLFKFYNTGQLEINLDDAFGGEGNK